MRWGILATGSIARTFAADVRRSRSGDLVAVGSRTQASADAFGAPRAHGSYEALLADDDVEAVYIATPHPMHADLAVAAAEAGKHVLCEKPMTTSAADTVRVVEAARANDVFLMEAFMYRCHPQMSALRTVLPAVGRVESIEAVHAFAAPASRLDPAGRLLAPELGGGAILDVGCYCVSGALLVAGEEPIAITAEAELGPTGVDLRATASLLFPSGATAQLTCAITEAEPPLLRVRGTDGTLTVPAPWLPSGQTRFELDQPGARSETVIASDGYGLYAFEADEVARCVAAGLRESPAMTWSESIAVARVLDAWREAIAG